MWLWANSSSTKKLHPFICVCLCVMSVMTVEGNGQPVGASPLPWSVGPEEHLRFSVLVPSTGFSILLLWDYFNLYHKIFRLTPRSFFLFFVKEMEFISSDYCTKDNDNEEESLLANVASLRHELKITEWSLHNLGEELSRQGNKITWINCKVFINVKWLDFIICSV